MRGGNTENSNSTRNIQPGEQAQENRGNSANTDPEPRQEPDPAQQETENAAENQAIYQTTDEKIRERVTCSTTSAGSFSSPPGEEAHEARGELRRSKEGPSFTLNLRAGTKARIGAGKFHAIQIKGVKENLTFKDCFDKKISLSPTLKKKGLRINRIFERKIDGESQLWMILKNENTNFHFQVCRGQRLAELDRRSKPV